jgi:hypothetical protein
MMAVRSASTPTRGVHATVAKARSSTKRFTDISISDGLGLRKLLS